MQKRAGSGGDTGIFKAAFWLCVCSLLIYLVGFVSPYWLQSWPSAKSQLVSMGLWQICLAGFMHPSDYDAKQQNGCFFMYTKRFYWVRSWMFPPWFVVTIASAVLALLALFASAGESIAAAPPNAFANHARCYVPVNS